MPQSNLHPRLLRNPWVALVVAGYTGGGNGDHVGNPLVDAKLLAAKLNDFAVLTPQSNPPDDDGSKPTQTAPAVSI